MLRSPFLVGLLINLAFATLGILAGALDWTGATAGMICGVTIYCAFGPSGFALLGSFAFVGFVATRFRYSKKLERGVAQEKGGRRTWVNVAANCLAPTICAALALLLPPDAGPSSALSAGLVASIACALGDTVATEVGQALAGQCYLLPRFSPAAPGTPGGISVAGSFWGLTAIVGLALGAFAFGLASLATGPAILMAAIGAFFAESYLHRIGFIRERGG